MAVLHMLEQLERSRANVWLFVKILVKRVHAHPRFFDATLDFLLQCFEQLLLLICNRLKESFLCAANDQLCLLCHAQFTSILIAKWVSFHHTILPGQAVFA